MFKALSDKGGIWSVPKGGTDCLINAAEKYHHMEKMKLYFTACNLYKSIPPNGYLELECHK